MNKELSEQIEKYEGFRNRIKALNYVGNIIYTTYKKCNDQF